MKAQFSIFLGYFLSSVGDLAPIIAVISLFQLVVSQQPIVDLGDIVMDEGKLVGVVV